MIPPVGFYERAIFCSRHLAIIILFHLLVKSSQLTFLVVESFHSRTEIIRDLIVISFKTTILTNRFCGNRWHIASEVICSWKPGVELREESVKR